MKFNILHNTVYKFSEDVFLEPHNFRFKPKDGLHSKVINFNIDISPKPAGISEQTDAENNVIHFCWFDGMTSELVINCHSIVEIQDYNPLGFILYPQEFFDMPFVYSDGLVKTLQPALEGELITNDLEAYGQEVLVNSNSKTIEFITNLTRQIHSDFTIESREIGEPYKPGQTFDYKIASCRDLSWMLIHLLRSMGIASRFVSGYFYPIVEDPHFELHAWVEVFLPGAGWVGLDPSNGIMTGVSHIPISSSSHFENTMPVTGSVRGSANSALTSELVIETVH